MCAVVSPVAPHRLWLPSRSDTSTSWISVMVLPGCRQRAADGAALQELIEARGVHPARGELVRRDQLGVQAEGRRDSADLAPGERVAHSGHGLGPVAAA